MIAEDVIQEAGRRLAAAVPPPAKVILFGSHARGEAAPDSDLDLLVIEREVPDRFGEVVRLQRVLRELPADVVVVSERHVHEWRDVHSTMLHDALREGRVLAQT